MGLQIVATGSALPEKYISNQDLEKYLDTTDEWIVERTGIRKRHIADKENDEETIASLGALASKRALEMANMEAEEIDLILAATCSSDKKLPCLACQIQEKLPGCKAAAFDIGAACSGFLIALSVAEGYLRSGAFKNILVVGAEVLSSLVDYNDRSTCILFGDGAGACIVKASDSPFYFSLGADGSGGQALYCEDNKKIMMNGQDVYRFATRVVPKVIKETIEKAEMTAEDVDIYFLHQANERIIKSIARNLGEAEDKFPMNLSEVGNMSSASIPVLLDEWNREGKIPKGSRLMLAGFGAGLTFGSSVICW